MSACLPAFTKLFGFIHYGEQGTHMAHVNFWSDPALMALPLLFPCYGRYRAASSVSSVFETCQLT